MNQSPSYFSRTESVPINLGAVFLLDIVHNTNRHRAIILFQMKPTVLLVGFSIEYFLLVAVILTLIISINFCVSKCSLQQALLSHYSHHWPLLAAGKFPEIICFDLSSSSVITIIKPISVDISKSKCIKTKTTRMENCPLSYGVETLFSFQAK